MEKSGGERIADDLGRISPINKAVWKCCWYTSLDLEHYLCASVWIWLFLYIIGLWYFIVYSNCTLCLRYSVCCSKEALSAVDSTKYIINSMATSRHLPKLKQSIGSISIYMVFHTSWCSAQAQLTEERKLILLLRNLDTFHFHFRGDFFMYLSVD